MLNYTIVKSLSVQAAAISIPFGIRIANLQSVDVAHGFGLSAFRINKTLNPGKEMTVEFKAKKKGEYTFACTVPCGAGHANMTGKFIVE